MNLNSKLTIINDCISTGLPFFPAYGLALDYSIQEYETARKSLTDRGMTEDDICIEHVQTEMIRLGFDLIFTDDEDNGAEVGRLNLDSIENNWKTIRKADINEMMNQSYDAETADSIIQCILFGELTYG